MRICAHHREASAHAAFNTTTLHIDSKNDLFYGTEGTHVSDQPLTAFSDLHMLIVHTRSLLTSNSPAVWGLAMVCWFVANANLELVISFPIVTMGPGLVNMFYGCWLFNEVSGLRNYLLLAASVALYALASVVIVLSKTPGSL